MFSALFTMRNVVLFFMSLTIVFSAFESVVPAPWGGYLKAASAAATGIAALFMHPPTLGGDAPPQVPKA